MSDSLIAFETLPPWWQVLLLAAALLLLGAFLYWVVSGDSPNR